MSLNLIKQSVFKINICLKCVWMRKISVKICSWGVRWIWALIECVRRACDRMIMRMSYYIIRRGKFYGKSRRFARINLDSRNDGLPSWQYFHRPNNESTLLCVISSTLKWNSCIIIAYSTNLHTYISVVLRRSVIICLLDVKYS